MEGTDGNQDKITNLLQQFFTCC